MIDEERGRLTVRTLIPLLIVLAGLYWVGNGSTSFYDRDEPRFAQPAKEFLFAKSWRDWIVPHFNGEPFFHKPPLSYWQMTAAYSLFGVNECSARLFSGLWTALTAVVLAAWLARRFTNTVGLAAAMAFSTSLIVIIEAKLATADATLGLLSILAVLGLWDTYRGEARFGTRLVTWLAVGLAILCKGPMIFILLAGVVGAMLAFDRNRRWVLSTGFWWGIPLALAIGVPWYVLANQYGGGGVMSRFVWYDLISRAMRPLESHRGFPGFYAVTMLLNAWPWSAFLIPVALYAWRNRREPKVKFLLAWLIGPTLLLEFVRTKMIHYWITILPAYAILLAMAVDSWIAEQDQSTWRRWNAKVMAVIAAVWALVLAGALIGSRHVFGGVLPGVYVLAGVLVVVIIFVILAGRRANLSQSVLAIFVTTALIAATVSTVVLPGLEPYKLGRQLARAMKSLGNETTSYALVHWQEPSTVFYLNPGDRPVSLGGADDFASFVKRPNTVIGVAQKGFDQLSPEMKVANIFRVLEGFDYTRGRRAKIYIANSGPTESR